MLKDTTKSIEEIQYELNLTVPSISKFVTEYKNNFEQFLKDPTEITTKIIEATINKKNYEYVAKDLNLSPSYIYNIGKKMSENEELTKHSKSFESFLSLLTKIDYNTFLNKKDDCDDKKFVVYINEFDCPDWYYENEGLYIDYPCYFSKYFTLSNNLILDVFKDQWGCYLKQLTGRKDYVSAETNIEKKELLKFLLLGCKFIFY